MVDLRMSLLVASAYLAGCGGATTAHDADSGTGDAGGAVRVGAMCVPSQEESASFSGFDFHEVGLDLDNAGCSGDPCILDHFQGRVSCPYGQSCIVPGTSTPVTAMVPPQCVDRRPADAVYCSCRCANAEGRTDDGATYCACPTGLTCSQFYASTGGSSANFAGAYCIKSGSTYDPNSACNATCDAKLMNCP